MQFGRLSSLAPGNTYRTKNNAENIVKSTENKNNNKRNKGTLFLPSQEQAQDNYGWQSLQVIQLIALFYLKAANMANSLSEL